MAVQLKSLALLFLFVGAVSLHAVRSSGQDVIVTFIMVQHAEMGQVFKIVGNSEKLGNWEPSKVENMTSTPGDAWAISVKLTKGAAYEYKPIVVDSDSGNTLCSANGNRPLTIPEDYSKSDHVETVFRSISCGYGCHENNACSDQGRGEDVIVTFVLVQSVMSGREFKIVGNAPEMCSWDLSEVENMTQTSVDVWASAVTLTKGKAYKYKPYVVDSVSGSTECFAHEELSLTIPEDYSKSNYVETVFYSLECGYACHGTPACSLHGDRSRQVM
ncbi:uncharacterized protein LOC131857191 isoform X2 [Cryptomeria japonica]|uniref:uncharacterized protein LOC131857191 isoform X2 n=1 Tax=Cryptomeria japonica TaxID=3369 RepID=UPI0027D9F9E5|nr:uncharacterized protein LOC131857191 isoform X2 [Cryptomeria japonica]